MLIFPNLSAGNIAYKLLNHLGGATAIGPILVGMSRPVHVLERGADVQDIVNMAAVAVVDAQERVRAEPTPAAPSHDADTRITNGLLEVVTAMATLSQPQRRQRVERSRGRGGLKAQGLAPDGRGPLEPRRARADPGRRSAAARASSPTWDRSVAVTSPHTGRSPNDKFVVKEPSSDGDVDWGKVNQPMHRRALRDAARRRARLSERARRAVRAGSLLRRRSGVPPVGPLRHARTRGTWRSCGTCSSAPTSTELPTFDPNFTVLHAPEIRGRSGDATARARARSSC